MKTAIAAPEPEDEQVEENILPNNGEFFGIPKEPVNRERGRDKERAKTLAEKPLMEAAIKRFEERIAYYQSLDSINEDDMANPERLIRRIEANKMLVQNLLDEKELLEGLLNNA